VRWSGQERGNVACCLYFFTYNINVGLSYTNLFMNFVRVSLASLRDTTNGQLAPAECGRRGFKSSQEIGLERALLSSRHLRLLQGVIRGGWRGSCTQKEGGGIVHAKTNEGLSDSFMNEECPSNARTLTHCRGAQAQEEEGQEGCPRAVPTMHQAVHTACITKTTKK
jgi:hypothetical protein